MGCTFCATGTMGLLDNLTAGEILEQLYHANKIEKIRGVVFMGMGEPLDNYNQVITSIKGMTDPSRFNLASHRVSISTVGIVPKILALVNDAPHVGLALSLHAPTQEKRLEIVPTSKNWPIEKILDATSKFIDHQNKIHSSKRHVLIEYVLISEVNDSEETAVELGNLLKSIPCVLNVIPYNPTTVPFDYKTPTIEAQNLFVKITKELGVKTILRQTMGSDIGSACGQLVVDCSGDIEDIGKVKKTRAVQIKKKEKKKLVEPIERGMEKFYIQAAIGLLLVGFVARKVFSNV